MKIYLAATGCRTPQIIDVYKSKFILESFYSFQEWQKPMLKNPNFLLDSGAFTFMQGTGQTDRIDEYIERYIDFINKNDVRKFFELDLDSVKGFEWVKKTRARIERETGKRVIPVWHINRGIEDFKKTCEEYDYIAIGGIASGELPKNKYAALSTLIKIAHGYGCKIHGLGFTYISKLNQYHFDSVDSSSWLAGGRYGQIHVFDGKKIKFIRPKGKRAKNYKEIDNFNFNEWLKFQQYAEKNL